MLAYSWLNGVRNWLSQNNRTRTSSRNTNRRLRNRGHLPIELLESRVVLSALSISDVSVVEGDAGTTNAVFTVTLTRTDDLTVTAVAISFNGTAADASDYHSILPTLLTFGPGETRRTVAVAVIGDTVYEPNETFFVSLNAPSNATIADSLGKGTIIDDDPALLGVPSVTLGVTPASLLEAAGTATVTATLSFRSLFDVTVALGFSGSAMNVSDYFSSAEQIVIPAGSLTGSVTLTALQDTLDETDEIIVIDINSVTNATESGTQQVTASIADDDPIGLSTLSISDVTVVEGNAGTTNAVFTVTLARADNLTVTVVAISFNGTATDASDYYSILPTLVRFDPGETIQTVTVAVIGDTVDEFNETFFVTLNAPSNATIADNLGQATIIDDDQALGGTPIDPPVGPPSVTLGLSAASLLEAGGTSTVTATLSAVSFVDVTVDLAFGGSAMNVRDYTRSADQIVIIAGSLTGNVTLTAVQDEQDETNETIVVDILGVTNGTESGTQQVTAVINDDDPPPSVTLSVAGTSLLEAGGTSTVTATLSAVSNLNITIALAFSGTATNVSDYTCSDTIVILAGSLSNTVTLTAVQDTLDELDETIVVDISGVINGTESGTQQVTASITDDDLPPWVTLRVAACRCGEPVGSGRNVHGHGHVVRHVGVRRHRRSGLRWLGQERQRLSHFRSVGDRKTRSE